MPPATEKCSTKSTSSPWMRDDHGRLLGVELDLDRVGVGLVTPVGVVADEGRALLGREALELERAGALECLAPVGRVEVGRDDDGVVVRGADERREVAVRGVEVEDDRRVVGRLDVPGREHAAERRLCVRGAPVGVDELLEGGDHVLRGHWGAVVERDARADRERPDRSVVVRLPALGEAGLELEVLVGEGQVLAGRAEHARATLVLDEERVRLGGRLNQGDADGSAGLNCARGRLAASGLRSPVVVVPAAGGCDEGEDGQRHADRRPSPHQLPAADLAGHVLVDEVVLEFRALATNLVDPALCLVHLGSFPEASQGVSGR